jgi:hypothetical protein
MRARCRGERVFLVSFPNPRRRRTIMNRVILPALMLLVLLAATAPSLAQEGNTKGDPANGPPLGPSPDRSATLSFELAVEAERMKA